MRDDANRASERSIAAREQREQTMGGTLEAGSLNQAPPSTPSDRQNRE